MGCLHQTVHLLMHHNQSAIAEEESPLGTAARLDDPHRGTATPLHAGDGGV